MVPLSMSPNLTIGVRSSQRHLVELANRESTTNSRELLVMLKQRGLRGIEFVVSDHHAGLKKRLQSIAWTRQFRCVPSHRPFSDTNVCIRQKHSFL